MRVSYYPFKLRWSFFLQGLALWILSACALLGGGTDIERASGYEVQMPAGWASTNRAESDRAYRLPSGNRVTLVSSCHRNPEAPLEVLTRHLLMGTRGVYFSSKEKKRFGNNEGLYSKVQAHLEGKPFHLSIFIMAKSDCVFDFTLMSPREISPSDSEEFETFISSFHYGKN
jgi:hypothetical protein